MLIFVNFFLSLLHVQNRVQRVAMDILARSRTAGVADGDTGVRYMMNTHTDKFLINTTQTGAGELYTIVPLDREQREYYTVSSLLYFFFSVFPFIYVM